MKLEALPFDPVHWPALQAKGWRFAIGSDHQEVFYVGISKGGEPVYQDRSGIWTSGLAFMLPPIPPPVVIEFKVGLFSIGNSYDIAVIPHLYGEAILIRLLTDDERAKGEVRVDG